MTSIEFVSSEVANEIVLVDAENTPELSIDEMDLVGGGTGFATFL